MIHRAFIAQGLSRRILAAVATIGLIVSLVVGTGSLAGAAVGNITGSVFRDYDANGERNDPNPANPLEPGEGGITVTVTDPAGTTASDTTDFDGSYSVSLSSLALGPYRVRFSGFGPGSAKPYLSEGPLGADNASSVTFVAGPGTVNFGVMNPAEYCQDNPSASTNCYVFGDQVGGASAADPTLVSFPYNAAGSGADPDGPPGTISHHSRADQIGTTYGLGWHRQARRLFAASFMKRHAGFGPGGPGAIYTVDPSSPSDNGTEFIDLNAVLPAGEGVGTDPHPSTPGGDWFHDPASYAPVGKLSLGDLDVSEDGQTLYTVNLATRKLVSIDLVDPEAPTAGAVSLNAIPNPCGAETGRPFALEVHDGLVYVGGVCPAQNSGSAADLSAYVYSFDPASDTFSASPLLQFALNYPKDGFADWRPWTDTFPAVSPGYPVNPSPMLTDIVFDRNSLVLGFRDRFGDQVGHQSGSTNTSDAGLYTAVTTSDMLRVCPPAGGGALALENNGSCGGITTAGASNGAGPGGGEYYHTGGFHQGEESLGGLLQIPGKPEVASTEVDPFRSFSAGVNWHNNATGSETRGLEIYVSPAAPTSTFGKTNGLGDLEAFCDLAPLEIGNRLWADSDGNGLQDPDEAGVGGATVRLYADANQNGVPDGAQIDSTTTDATGNWRFNSLTDPLTAESGFVVEFDVTTATDVANRTLVPTTRNAGSDDGLDSDAVIAPANGRGQVAVVTDTAGINNHDLDTGLATPLATGNQVWEDLNNNGQRDSGEPGLANVDVQIYLDSNANGTPDSAELVSTTTTASDGTYGFGNLPSGTYIVVLPSSNFTAGNAVSGYKSSSGQGGSLTGPYEPAPDPDNNVDNDDNGALGTSGVASLPFTLVLGAEPTSEDSDANTNLTVDFGLFREGSLGDRAFRDSNRNGVQDSGEPGVPGVTVKLLRTDGTQVATTTTDANGSYVFNNLIAGQYQVEFSGFPTGWSFTTANQGSDTLDSDADPSTGRTAAVTVVSDQSNLTVDAGAYPVIDLAIVITGPDTARPGDQVNFKITVTNNGPATTTAPITVTDELGTGLEPRSGTGTGWSCSIAGQTVTCVRTDPMAPGTTSDITVAAVVRASSGTLTNNARVSSSELESNSANNVDSAPVSVLGTSTDRSAGSPTAFTGFRALFMVLSGLALVAGGIMLLLLGRKRRSRDWAAQT